MHELAMNDPNPLSLAYDIVLCQTANSVPDRGFRGLKYSHAASLVKAYGGLQALAVSQERTRLGRYVMSTWRGRAERQYWDQGITEAAT